MVEKKTERKGVPYEFRYKGKGKFKCRICNSSRSVITSYGLQICRKCFRENADKIGFRSY